MTNDRYLFRGFNKDLNGTETIYLDGKEIKGSWVYGDLAHSIYLRDNKCFISTYQDYIPKDLDATMFEVIPETVGQWSGLENQYHQKIFEHDILREYSNEIEDWVVSYEYGKFVGTSNNVSEDLWEIHDMEVVGNIFDEWWNI